MKGFLGWMMTVALLAGLSAPVFAQDELDITMRMVTNDDQLTDSVVREIELPDTPVVSPQGLRNRDEPGAAAQQGRELGKSVSERAREVRGIVGEGAGGARPELPDVSNPGNGPGERPDIPGRPQDDNLPDSADTRR